VAEGGDTLFRIARAARLDRFFQALKAVR